MPILENIKQAYLIWFDYYKTIPKNHRYSLGIKIDSIFIDLIEGTSIASFLQKEEKLPWIKFAIRKNDTLKLLLMILSETKSIDEKKYITISLKIDTIGKMLGGWNNQITKSIQEKQNSPR